MTSHKKLLLPTTATLVLLAAAALAAAQPLNTNNALITMEHDAIIRLSIFIALLLILLLSESLIPKVKPQQARPRHWLTNISLVLIASLLVRLLLPAGLSAYALSLSSLGIGLFNQLALPFWASLLISIIALDATIYWQHRLFHSSPLLWRLHKVHHSDIDIDVSSALRFHPLEILLSIGVKLFAIRLLGISAEAVIAFEILLNGMAMFNHSNIRLPQKLDKLLQLLIVTPDMHRIHHSIKLEQSNSNYGFNISLWDKAFNSYTPRREETIITGLSDIRHSLKLRHLLLLPFKRQQPQTRD